MVDNATNQPGVMDYRNNCIDDHEQRIRHLEANNKEQAKLFVMSEKLENMITALDQKNAVRFISLEKWMDSQIAIVAAERATRREHVEEKRDINTEKRDWTSAIIGVGALGLSVIFFLMKK
jgi:hypothetical protein